MFMLLAAIPALAVMWALGGRLAALIDRRWQGLWLIWGALGVQVALFSPLGGDLPGGAVRAVHVLTYLPVLAFLVLNRDAGLGLVAAGVASNLVAIVLNGGVMPADPAAQQVVIADPTAIGHPLNTDTGASRLLFLGDTMALPDWFPWASSFSVGDAVLAAGLVWAFAVLTTSGPPPSALRSVGVALRRLGRRRAAAAALTASTGGWAAIGAVCGWALGSHRPGMAAAALVVVSGIRALAALRPRVAALLTRRATRGLACVGVAVAALAGWHIAPGWAVAAVPGAAILTVGQGRLAAAGGGTLRALAAAVGPAIGLPAGAILLALASPPVALAAAGACAAAGVGFAGRQTGSAARAAAGSAGRLGPSALGGLAAMAVAIACLGAAAAAFPAWLPGSAGLEGADFGLVGGALAAGGMCGALAAASLRPPRTLAPFGLSLVFCGAAAVLLATATLPMTVVAAAVAVGVCASISCSLAPLPGSATLRGAAWVALGAGSAAGSLSGTPDAAWMLWLGAGALAVTGTALLVAGAAHRTPRPAPTA